ncbi:MAG TPA: hypothetical protein VH679_14245 [Vicinamibacterales bacterium]|jgi:hypothetical protein
MREAVVRAAGLAFALTYAAFIGWLFVSRPGNVSQITGGLAASIGAYRTDSRQFEDGLRFFRADQFVEARAAFLRADPAQRDARTQFYVAYSFYRQGWGRTFHDDALYAQGLEAVDRAIALAPGGRLVIDDDPNLRMTSADELRAELDAGRRFEGSDLNPLRLFRTRK